MISAVIKRGTVIAEQTRGVLTLGLGGVRGFATFYNKYWGMQISKSIYYTLYRDRFVLRSFWQGEGRFDRQPYVYTGLACSVVRYMLPGPVYL